MTDYAAIVARDAMYDGTPGNEVPSIDGNVVRDRRALIELVRELRATLKLVCAPDAVEDLLARTAAFEETP